VELLKGVSALYYGISTPSGIVNLVMKRAGDKPVTNVTLTGDAEGSYGGGVDIGRKFGADKQFGVRLNGYGSHVETPINGVNGYRYLASGAFDWQATDKLSFKLDVEHYRRATDEPGGISLAAFQLLKSVPDPHNRYAPVNAPYRTWSTNVLGRMDYAINDDWSVRAETGLADSAGNAAAPISASPAPRPWPPAPDGSREITPPTSIIATNMSAPKWREARHAGHPSRTALRLCPQPSDPVRPEPAQLHRGRAEFLQSLCHRLFQPDLHHHTPASG
jgi:outer membrane receptor protein involved in Fe transport